MLYCVQFKSIIDNICIPTLLVVEQAAFILPARWSIGEEGLRDDLAACLQINSLSIPTVFGVILIYCVSVPYPEGRMEKIFLYLDTKIIDFFTWLFVSSVIHY